MNDIRINNIENSRLTEDQLELVSGGKNNVKVEKSGDGVKITVACGKCGKHFTINSKTTIHKCSCGFENKFYG